PQLHSAVTKHTHTHTHTNTHTHTHTNTDISHTHTHTQTHTQPQTHTPTHTHTHSKSHLYSSPVIEYRISETDVFTVTAYTTMPTNMTLCLKCANVHHISTIRDSRE